MAGKIVGWMMIEMTDLKSASITAFLISSIGAFCMSTEPHELVFSVLILVTRYGASMGTLTSFYGVFFQMPT